MIYRTARPEKLEPQVRFDTSCLRLPQEEVVTPNGYSPR